MTIRKKLITGYLLLGFFLAVQAGISFYFNDQAKELADQAIEHNFEASLQLSDLTILAQKMRRYEKEAFIYVTDTQRRNRYVVSWGRAYETAIQDLQAMIANKDGIFSNTDIDAMQRWHDGLTKYGWEFRKLAKVMTYPEKLKGKPETTANAMIREGKEQLAPLLREAPTMRRHKREQAREFAQEIDDNYELAEVLYVVLTLLGLGLTALIVFVLPGQLTGALQNLIDQGERLSLGTQTDDIAMTTVPEFDRLARALRRIQVTHGALLERLRRKGLPTTTD